MDETEDLKGSGSGDLVKEFLETLAESGFSQNAGKSEVQDIPDPPEEDKDGKKIDIPQQSKDSSPVEGDQSAHVERTVERTSVVEEKMKDGEPEVKDSKPLGAGSLLGDHGITKKKKRRKSSSAKAWMDKPISSGSWKF